MNERDALLLSRYIIEPREQSKYLSLKFTTHVIIIITYDAKMVYLIRNLTLNKPNHNPYRYNNIPKRQDLIWSWNPSPFVLYCWCVQIRSTNVISRNWKKKSGQTRTNRLDKSFMTRCKTSHSWMRSPKRTSWSQLKKLGSSLTPKWWSSCSVESLKTCKPLY